MLINMNSTRFGTPGMEQEAEAVYSSFYGNNGIDFVRILRESPYEIAVLSRLIMYLEQKQKGG